MLFCYSKLIKNVILSFQFYKKCYFVIPISFKILFYFSNLIENFYFIFLIL